MNCRTAKTHSQSTRPSCLIENPRIREAIAILVEELEEDYFLNSLQECMICRQGQERSNTINLHCQLKSVMDILRNVNHQMIAIKQSHPCLCHKPR